MCMGRGERGGGNGRRWKWKVLEQVEEQEREQVVVEVLLQERWERKRRSWRRGSEWKVSGKGHGLQVRWNMRKNRW